MSIYTETLPQNIAPIKTVNFKQLLGALPQSLPFSYNFWIAGKLARYGMTTDNLVFLVEGEETEEMRHFFNALVEPLGINATVSDNWKGNKYQAIRLYNEGRLIIDKATMSYTELPVETREVIFLTAKEAVSKMPTTIEWKQTLYLTGGLVKNGWSGNDGDIIVSGEIEKKELGRMSRFFTDVVGWKFDVGQAVMPEREPVYLYKLYENGTLCLPQ